MKLKFGVKEVVATGIGTALFIVLTNAQIPFGIIPNTALQSRVAVLTFFSAVFGPIVGGAIGLIGHALGDAIFYGSIYWSWVFPDALFNVVQVIANALAWILLAPVLDILIYAEPAKKVFTQGILAFIGNIIVAAVLGTLLAFAYSKIGAKSSSLSKED